MPVDTWAHSTAMHATYATDPAAMEPETPAGALQSTSWAKGRSEVELSVRPVAVCL